MTDEEIRKDIEEYSVWIVEEYLVGADVWVPVNDEHYFYRENAERRKSLISGKKNMRVSEFRRVPAELSVTRQPERK